MVLVDFIAPMHLDFVLFIRSQLASVFWQLFNDGFGSVFFHQFGLSFLLFLLLLFWFYCIWFYCIAWWCSNRFLLFCSFTFRFRLCFRLWIDCFRLWHCFGLFSAFFFIRLFLLGFVRWSWLWFWPSFLFLDFWRIDILRFLFDNSIFGRIFCFWWLLFHLRSINKRNLIIM